MLKPRSSIMLPWATNRIMIRSKHPLTLHRRKELYVRCNLTSQTVVYSVEIIKELFFFTKFNKKQRTKVGFR